MGVQRHSLAALPPIKRLGIYYTRSWVSSSAGLDRCRRSRPPSAFDLRTDKPVASRKWCKGKPEVATWRRNCPIASQTPIKFFIYCSGFKAMHHRLRHGKPQFTRTCFIFGLSVLISWIWLIIKYLEETKLIVFLNYNKTSTGTNSTN